MSLLTRLKDAWRKNSDELLGLWNGALPDFVTARKPREVRGGVPVFCYHLVEADEFEADLQFLAANGYRTLSADELVQYLAGTHALDGRAVMLTFDDGPRNFFDVAFPLLKRYGARAVAFIAPGLHRDSGSGDVDDAEEARPMTWQELQIIHGSGLVQFQSHTFESRFIPKWPMEAALSGCDPSLEHKRRRAPLPLLQDLEWSRSEIEKRLPGTRVEHLAFPMYVGSADAVDAARSLGFRACYWGLMPGRGLNRSGDSPFYVSRLSDEFLRRLPGRGRISLRELGQVRLRRIREGREWRRKFPSPPGAASADRELVQ